MKKVREEKIPLINYICEVKDGDVSDNQDVQRYFCSDIPFINGIGVTILTGDYLPPLILAEVPLNEDVVQKYIVDGLQRTTAMMQIRYNNHKFTGAIEDHEIEYQTKKLDENGVAIKDDDGNFVWEKKIFSIKNKTYDDFPKELKKRFDNFQVSIASYQNCTMEKVSKLIRKLNNHKGMNSCQKALTWIPTYARRIKNIAESGFIKNSMHYSNPHRKNGEYLNMVCRCVMLAFHFDKYKSGAKDVSFYLEDHSSVDEFNTIQDYMNRLEKVCESNFQDIFVKKDVPVWFAVFHKFTQFGLEDEKFADFLTALTTELHSVEVDGVSYDVLNKETGTTHKKLITQKLNLYIALMNDYLHIKEDKVVEDNNLVKEDTLIKDEAVKSEDTMDLVKTVNPDATSEDLEEYGEYVDSVVRISSPLYHQCHNALLAITAYVYQNNTDKEFAEWVDDYANNTYEFDQNQRVNFENMKLAFQEYLKTKAASI